jgi:hypothetical protein
MVFAQVSFNKSDLLGSGSELIDFSSRNMSHEAVDIIAIRNKPSRQIGTDEPRYSGYENRH